MKAQIPANLNHKAYKTTVMLLTFIICWLFVADNRNILDQIIAFLASWSLGSKLILTIYSVKDQSEIQVYQNSRHWDIQIIPNPSFWDLNFKCQEFRTHLIFSEIHNFSYTMLIPFFMKIYSNWYQFLVVTKNVCFKLL